MAEEKGQGCRRGEVLGTRVCVGEQVCGPPYQISEVEIQTVHSDQDTAQIGFRKEQNSGKWVTEEGRGTEPSWGLM